MKGKSKGWGKEKIISAIVACAVILTLSAGVYSVVKESRRANDNKNNVVDLNERTQNNVAIRTEDGGVEPENTDSSDSKEDAATGDDDPMGNEIASVNNSGTGSTSDVSSNSVNEDLQADDKQEQVPVAASVKKNPLDAYSFSESDSLLRPVNGDVVLKYSMDSTIYFESLNVYKCNPAISIAANVGDSVAVAADGIVQSVVDSEETKTTVTVGLGDGYEATYGLLDGVNVKSGDSVYKGQHLGTVAEPSAYYVKEGANLYFKLTKDGIPVNPMDYFE